VWISFHPFQSLAEPPRTVTEGGDRVNQIAFSVLFVALAAWIYFHEPQRLLHLVRPAMIVTVLWCAASVVLSWEPALARLRRPAPAIALVAALLAGFNLFTIGTVYVEPVRHLVEELLPDHSFTGRIELWQFAVEHVMQHVYLPTSAADRSAAGGSHARTRIFLVS